MLDVLHADRLALCIHDGDLQRELTYDGLRAAEAKGNKDGRRPAVTSKTIADVRAAYLVGQTIAALAREHGVSRGAVRTAVTDLMPEHAAADEGTTAPELPVSLDMPGKLAGFLRATELDDAERAALNHGVTVRRGQGYTLRVTTSPAVHRQRLARRQPLDGAQCTPAVPAQRKPAGVPEPHQHPRGRRPALSSQRQPTRLIQGVGLHEMSLHHVAPSSTVLLQHAARYRRSRSPEYVMAAEVGESR
ncbi:hypothetical protein [Streptomyces sp. NPDC050704]|uniref:hypothetical protein n=1 Tax=Streptomyces sp. NPDC050704 TaxID=3157219 RepID=UPI00342F3461